MYLMEELKYGYQGLQKYLGGQYHTSGQES